MHPHPQSIDKRFSGYLALCLFLLGVFAGKACAEEKKAAEKENKQTAIKREELLYDGKTFEQWRRYSQRELKPERVAEAMKAFAAFGVNGYGKEATVAIVDAMKKYNPARKDGPDALITGAAWVAVEKINQPAVPVLAEALKKHPSKYSRLFIVRTLRGCLLVAPAVMDKEKEVRNAAIDELSDYVSRYDENGEELQKTLRKSHQVEGFILALKKAFHEGEHETRCGAASLLGVCGPQAKSAIPALLEGLKDKSDGVPEASLRTLVKLKVQPKRFLPILIQMAKDKNDSKCRCVAVGRLAALGPLAKAALPVLIEAAGDKKFRHRLVAMKALAWVKADAKKVVPLLKKFLLDKNEVDPVRLVAADGLLTYDAEPKQVVRILSKIMSQWLSQWLSQERTFGPFPYHGEFLSSLNEYKKASLRRRLEILNREAANASEGHLEVVDACYYLIEFLGKHGSKAGAVTPRLVELYNWWFLNSTKGQTLIARTLGKIGPGAKEALPLLREAARSENADLRQAAAVAIERIGRKK